MCRTHLTASLSLWTPGLKSVPFLPHQAKGHLPANGSTISVYLKATIKVNLHLRRAFEWSLLVADVSQPILGADFFTHYNLCVNLKDRKLHGPLTGISTPTSTTKGSSTLLSTIAANNRHASLLKFYPSLTQPYSAVAPVKHHALHFVGTTGPLPPLRPDHSPHSPR